MTAAMGSRRKAAAGGRNPSKSRKPASSRSDSRRFSWRKGKRWSRKPANSSRRSSSGKKLIDDTGLSPAEVFALAHAVHRSSEWCTAKAAARRNLSPSWHIVYDICGDVDAFKAFQASHPGFRVSEDDEAAAAGMLEWAADRANHSDDGGTFYQDLVVAMKAEQVYGHAFALLCAGAAAYRWDNERHISEAHVGEVGERAVFELTLKAVTPIPPKRKRFGMSYRLGFWDADGNAIVWFASHSPKSLGLEFEKPIAIKATVRNHREYKGSKQTIITRGKLLAAAA